MTYPVVTDADIAKALRLWFMTPNLSADVLGSDFYFNAMRRVLKRCAIQYRRQIENGERVLITVSVIRRALLEWYVSPFPYAHSCEICLLHEDYEGMRIILMEWIRHLRVEMRVINVISATRVEGVVK